MQRSAIAVHAKALQKALFGIVLLFIIGLVPFSVASGADTQIDATVCSGDSSNAVLTIETPQSDAVVDRMPLTISGVLNNVTQIDIEIDGSYSHTIPVSSTQDSYSTAVNINKGTHTIKLTGNDVCQVANPTATIIVTYHPRVEPSNGGSTPTETPGTATPGGGVTVSEELGGSPSQQNKTTEGGVVPFLRGIGNALDFDVTMSDGGLVAALARFSLFTIGILLAIFGFTIVRYLRLHTVAVSATRGLLADPRLKHHMKRNTTITRLFGVFLVIVALTI